MAFLLKSQGSRAGSTPGDQPVLFQSIRVSRATDTLPQTGSEDIFNVEGGRIALVALIGEVTVAVGAGTTPDLNVYVNSDAGATNGALATDVVIASDEVGTLYAVEGDGTALVAVSSGFAQACNNPVVINPGTIGITTSESVAGSVKWDLYYFPLDASAYVTPTAV